MNYTYELKDIDKIEKSELKELVKLYEEIFETKINENSIKSQIQGKYDKAKWIFAKDKDKIIGFITGAYFNDNTIHMYNFGVKKEYRLKGIGRKLFNMIKEKDKEMIFLVDKDRYDLMALYEVNFYCEITDFKDDYAWLRCKN